MFITNDVLNIIEGMKKIISIIALSAIFMVIFMPFVLSAEGKDKQQDDGRISSGTVILPIGYKGNETGTGNGEKVAERKENETKALKERENKTGEGVNKEKTKGREINETDGLKGRGEENKTKKGINETEDIEHGKEGFPPGLNWSITQGKPSNASIEVRIRNIERIREKFQEINKTINATGKPGLRMWPSDEVARTYVGEAKLLRHIGQYVQNLEDISILISNESIGGKVSEIAKKIDTSLEKSRRVEERIRGRNFITRFLFGGDKNSAKEIDADISSNKRMIEELRNIENETDDELNPLLEGHIRLLEEENVRLESVSKAEFGVFGLFGWLF